MKRSFTLLMSLFLVIGSMWAQVFPETSSAEAPKYYTIASYNRGGYLTNVGNGKGVEHVATAKGSIWYFTKADDNGGLHFCNFAGGYLAADKTISETAGTWYVLANGVNKEGVSISSTNPISSASCIDANNYDTGVGAWHPSTSDWHGTTWVFAEVTDFSVIFNVDEAKANAKAELDVLASETAIYPDAASAKANIDAVQAEGTSAEQLLAAIDAVNQCVVDYKNAAYQALEDKYFTFATPARSNGFMKLEGNRVVGLAEASSPAAVWQFVHADNAVKVFNPYTGKYLGEPGDNSADVPVTANAEDAAAYQLVINDKSEKAEAKVKFTSNGKSVHMAGGSVLVRWNDGGASEWTVAEISEFSGIASLHKAAALAAVEAYSALPEIFETAAAKEAINAVSATDWSAFAAVDEAANKAIPTGTFAFQATSGDNHRDSVWVSANMETSKAIGAVEQDENAHWTLKPANGGAFYIYNVKNGLYMGNPGGNCALTESPVAAYTIEVIDAEKNVVEFKCSGQTLHASNHDDDKLMNYDGDEAASRWTIVAIVEEPEVDPNDYTSYIKNADLSTSYAEGAASEDWDLTNSKGIKDGYARISGKVFDFSQTITLPAGQYKMTAKAAYRFGGDEQAEYNAIQAGGDTHLAKLYAATASYKYEANVMNRYEGASENDYANGSGSVTVNNLFVPNSSAAVKAWFDANQYVNVLVFNVQEDGEVKIGIAKEVESSDYTNIGAWTLTRLGDAEADPKQEPEYTEEDYDLTEGTWSDATSYLVNADFASFEGWTIEGLEKNSTSLRVMEFYSGWGAQNKTAASAKQNVELPAGIYRLSGSAWYRYSETWEEKYEKDKSLGYLVAGEASAVVPTIESAGLDPLPSYDNAADAFYNKGLYGTSVEFTLDNAANVAIGYECVFEYAYSWFIVGAVKLEKKQTLKDNFLEKAMAYSMFGQSSMALYSLGAVQEKFYETQAVVESLYGAISAGTPVLKKDVVAAMELMENTLAEIKPIVEYFDGTFSDTKWAMYDIQDNSAPISEDAATAFDEAIQAAFDVTTVATLAELEAKVAEMEAARQTYVVNALPINGYAFDYSFFLTNPSFETGDLTGWTVARNSAETAVFSNEGNYTTAGGDGKKLFNSWWNGVYLSQEAEGLPNGNYRLTASLASGDGGNAATIYLVANGEQKGFVMDHKSEFEDCSIEFKVTDGKIHIASVGGNDDETAEAPGTYNADGYWWYKSDNYRIYYLGDGGVTSVSLWTEETYYDEWAKEDVQYDLEWDTPRFTEVGQTFQFKVEVEAPEDADKTVTWSVSNDKVLSIDENGLLKVIGSGQGTFVVKATAPNGMSASCEVYVSAFQEGDITEMEVTYNGESWFDATEKGATYQLVVTYNEDATNVSLVWSSDNEDVVTVDQNGLVTIVGNGYAEVSVVAPSGVEASITIGVEISGDDPTGIESVESQNEAVIYDLSGRRVQTMTKGLYIVNGRKVIVK